MTPDFAAPWPRAGVSQGELRESDTPEKKFWTAGALARALGAVVRVADAKVQVAGTLARGGGALARVVGALAQVVGALPRVADAMTRGGGAVVQIVGAMAWGVGAVARSVGTTARVVGSKRIPEGQPGGPAFLIPSAAMSEPILIRIAHSPDSDDAFMFYALTQGQLDIQGLRIEHVLRDIETLNQAAFQGTYEITAFSFHAYAHLADRYQIMPSGASFGDGYGPIVVSRRPYSKEELAGVKVAIPGELTTAHLALRLWQPEVTTTIVPFDRILDVVRDGEALAGVVIHEGQLTYSEMGLGKVVDLGEWWKGETGLPLPLGGNGIKRDLPEDLKRRLCRLLTESIVYGLDHRQEALDYAVRYARGLEDDPVRSDRFVGMYVNDWTRDYGEAGRRAVRLLLDRGFEAGILPRRVEAEFVPI